MPTQSHSTIDAELRKAGIANDDAMARARCAAAIQGTGQFFGQNEAVRLKAHFAVGYVGLAIEEALVAALLDGSWAKLDADLRERAREAADDRRQVEADSSGMSHVTESNPYGWAKPETKRGQDHDWAGAWNPYRQAFNLTASERAMHGTRDHKVRGCTRWDVLRKTGHPTPHFDAHAVAVAQHKTEAPDAPQREVYGG